MNTKNDGEAKNH